MTSLQSDELNCKTLLPEKKELPLNKFHISKDSSLLIRTIRRKFYLTSKEKELMQKIQTGLDDGRRAAMLNIFKHGRA